MGVGSEVYIRIKGSLQAEHVFILLRVNSWVFPIDEKVLEIEPVDEFSLRTAWSDAITVQKLKRKRKDKGFTSFPGKKNNGARFSTDHQWRCKRHREE